MQTEHHVDLTSAEMANLWTAYLNDTMVICVLKYALATVQNTEIRAVLEFALQLSQSHVQQLIAMFNEEQLMGLASSFLKLYTCQVIRKDTFVFITEKNRFSCQAIT